jgi:hypothetical protein
VDNLREENEALRHELAQEKAATDTHILLAAERLRQLEAAEAQHSRDAERIRELEQQLDYAIHGMHDEIEADRALTRALVLAEQAEMIRGLQKDAARYKWLKAEDRKSMPRATISWRQLYGLPGGNLPCKLGDGDDLDALIDTALTHAK